MPYLCTIKILKHYENSCGNENLNGTPGGTSMYGQADQHLLFLRHKTKKIIITSLLYTLISTKKLFNEVMANPGLYIFQKYKFV